MTKVEISETVKGLNGPTYPFGQERVRRLPAGPYVRVLTSDLHVQLRTRVLLDPVKIRRKNLYSNSRDTSCREAGVSMVV